MNRSVLGKKPVSFLKATMAFAVALSFFALAVPVVGVETFDDTTVRIHPYTQTVNKGENNTTVCILPYAQAVNKGETFNVSIRVEPGEPIMGINIGLLSFDPALLHLNSVTEGDIFDPYDTFTSGIVNNTNGTVTGIGGSTPLSNATASPGSFCNISFTAQGKIGTSLLDLEDIVVTNISGVKVPVIVNDGEVAVVWSVTLDFNESSGENDYVVFGEATTANDGPPHDNYDTPKAPEPQRPYIRAWFDDGMPEPYDFLWCDYQQYPDTEKTWNLDAGWGSNSSTTTNVTISWNVSEFNDCEYDSVVLTRYDPFDDEWDFAADMLISDNYTYAPLYFNKEWLIDHFRINATTDTTPPEITDVGLMASDPMDTDIGWENISCTVTDTGVGIKDVELVVTYPNATTVEFDMIKDGNTYSYNTTLTQPGNYSYHIWADDIRDNENTSTPGAFILPPNYEADMDYATRTINFWDLVEVVKHYGETGADGWIREDVDNDGTAGFWDLVEIVKHYGETW